MTLKRFKLLNCPVAYKLEMTEALTMVSWRENILVLTTYQLCNLDKSLHFLDPQDNFSPWIIVQTIWNHMGGYRRQSMQKSHVELAHLEHSVQAHILNEH